MDSTPNGKATESDDILIVVPGRLPLRGGSALRGLIGLLLAACIFAAAFVSQSSYWWRGQADHCPVGATARFDVLAAA
jgi:hypothetical protein